MDGFSLDNLAKQYPGREAIGYWNKGDHIVINLKPTKPDGHCGEVCYVIVSQDGSIRPTNPLISKLNPKERINI